MSDLIKEKIDADIKSMFRDEPHPLAGLNNVKVNYIVFSNNRIKASNKMNSILESIDKDNLLRVIKIKDIIREIQLKDGARYIWLNTNRYATAYRCRKVIIDRDLSRDELDIFVLPSAWYCGKDDVEIF